jgi:membrane protein
MFMFFMTANSLVNQYVFNVINIIAFVLELFSFIIILMSKLQSNFATGLITYIMGVVTYITAPFAVIGLGGGEQFLLFQLFVILLYPIIIFLLMLLLGGVDGQQVLKQKVISVIFGIPGAIIVISVILLILIGNPAASWLLFGLQLLFSPLLFLSWGYILYPLRHKSDE